ncbi:MAG: putative transport system permease protein [Clostridium butyricum]|nr:putative transport system permease protein [Clostridium butyricum]
MILYSLKSLYYNKKKYIILDILSTVAFGFVYFILQVLDYVSNKGNNEVKADINFNVLMITFIVVFVFFAVMIITAVLNIFYKMRKNEMHILKTLGANNKTISKIFIGELSLLSLIISFTSLILGLIITHEFFNYYDVNINQEIGVMAEFLLLSYLIFLIIGILQFRKVLLEHIIKKNANIKSSNYLSKIIVGAVFIVVSFFISYNIAKLGCFIIGAAILVNPALYFILTVLETIFKNLVPPIYISIKQIKFNFKKASSLINNVSISIVLIVLLFTMYNSVKMSGIEYSKKNMKFNQLIQLNTIVPDNKINENNVFKALSFDAVYTKNNMKLLATGIDNDYVKFENLDIKNGSLSNLFNNNNNLVCIIPELMRINNGIKIGDTIELKILKKTANAKVVGSIYTYNINQIYINKNVLSKKILGAEGVSNTYYAVGNIDNITKKLNELNIKYDVISRDRLIEEYKNGILKGTEMIDTFLYIYLVISIFMIINMFLMSLEERSRYNNSFKLIGMRKLRIILMNTFEGIFIIIAGSILGLIFGTILTNGLPSFVESSYGIRMRNFIPWTLLFDIVVCAQAVTIIATFILSLFSNGEVGTKLIGREE